MASFPSPEIGAMPAGALRRGAQRVGAYIANKGSIGISNGFEHAGTGRIGGPTLSPPGSRNASLQKVKQRMKSVRNIGKITKAMKMVAASRLRAVQTKCDQSRGIVKPGLKALGDPTGAPSQKTALIAITSDRGLCGSINANIVKQMRILRKATSENSAEHEIIPMGEKGRTQLMRTQMKDSVPFVFLETTKLSPSWSLVCYLADQISSTGFDKAHILFNRFQSAISFKPTIATVLSAPGMERQAESEGLALDGYEIEGPDRNELLQDLAEFHFGVMLYTTILENSTSEVASRMQAMENSSKSANEMLDKLNLTYNRTRQAAITTELTEIVSGAAAISG